MEIALLIVVVIAVLVLALVIWRARPSTSAAGGDDTNHLKTRVTELETQLDERDRQLDETREEHDRRLTDAREERDKQVSEIQKERDTQLGEAREERDKQVSEIQKERDAARDELREVRGERESALRELAKVTADHEARNEELSKAREDLDTHFKGVAANVVKASGDTFLKQAKEQFENQRKLSDTDLEKRQQAIDQLVKPVRENLEKFEKRVGEIEEKREGAYEGLRSQIGQLREATGGLREALRSPQVRGLWGEQTLRNILEISGMREHIDFEEQYSTATDTGKVRPDAVVHVPGGVNVVIDAKTPLDSYLEAYNEKDEQRQGDLLKSHARSLLGHAKTLGGKDYAAAIDGSPDFTVMFVPADPILDAAVNAQPTLWEDAWQKHRVLIATPGLLLALLRTVALAWQQQDLQKNAREIAEGATALYDSLRVYVDHVDNVGKGLQRAVDSYNKSIGSLEGRVLPRARKFEELGPAANSKVIGDLSRVDVVPRVIDTPELAASKAEADLTMLTTAND